MISEIVTLLKRCDGVKVTEKTVQSNFGNGNYVRRDFFKTGPIVVPDDVYILIDATATKGTIGKLVGLEIKTYGPDDKLVSSSSGTYIIQVENRAGTNRIPVYHSTILKDHDGSTKFVRNIKEHEKVELPLHVNKFKQTIHVGDWLVGLGAGKIVHFGQVTRYGKSSVWIRNTPSIEKSKEDCITRPLESFVLPEGVEYEQLVTIMILSGWTND